MYIHSDIKFVHFTKMAYTMCFYQVSSNMLCLNINQSLDVSVCENAFILIYINFMQSGSVKSILIYKSKTFKNY